MTLERYKNALRSCIYYDPKTKDVEYDEDEIKSYTEDFLESDEERIVENIEFRSVQVAAWSENECQVLVTYYADIDDSRESMSIDIIIERD